jgi:hypothetical protein
VLPEDLGPPNIPGRPEGSLGQDRAAFGLGTPARSTFILGRELLNPRYRNRDYDFRATLGVVGGVVCRVVGVGGSRLSDWRQHLRRYRPY